MFKHLLFIIFFIVSFLLALLASLFGRKQAHYTARHVIKPIFDFFFPLKIEGEKSTETSRGVILAGNHTGVLDPAIIEMAYNRPVSFLMASWMQKIPGIGFLAKRFKAIPVLRKGAASKNNLIQALDKTVDKLKSGEAVCIFPEGKPTRDGNISRFKKGVAYLHKKSKAPVIPFAIHGGFEAWPSEKRLPKGLPTFRNLTISFGKPYNNPDADENFIIEQLQQKVQEIKSSLEQKEDSVNFISLMLAKFEKYAPYKALCVNDKQSHKCLTYEELLESANKLAGYFQEQGIKKGDRIAILSDSGPEWGTAFFASVISGAIAVPLDIKLTYEELNPLLSDASPVIICASSSLAEIADRLKAEVHSVNEVFIMDKNSYTGSSAENPKISEHDPDETMLLVYTSGTTGPPKGVMITFRNILSQFRDFDKIYNLTSRQSLISILPLNHMFEITTGFLAQLYRGSQIAYLHKLYPKTFLKCAQERKITMLVAVPEFLKVLKEAIEKELTKSSKAEKNLFKLCFKMSQYIPVKFLRKFLFFKIHKKLGGKLREFISGGAPLDNEIAEFFTRVGIPVYQGYGLTETGPVVSGNTPGHNRIGSVGKPLPGVQVKISGQGEIMVKGPNVMKGYYNRPDLTEEAIDKNGWFHTGDLGEFDDGGYLYVTGRLKNVIVLSEGEKIQPEEVEEILSKSSLIKEICVIGWPEKAAEKVIAIIVPESEINKETIKKEVNKMSKSLTSYKKPQEIILRTEELPKTTTGKVKRRAILEWYSNQ